MRFDFVDKFIKYWRFFFFAMFFIFLMKAAFKLRSMLYPGKNYAMIFANF